MTLHRLSDCRLRIKVRRTADGEVHIYTSTKSDCIDLAPLTEVDFYISLSSPHDRQVVVNMEVQTATEPIRNA